MDEKLAMGMFSLALVGDKQDLIDNIKANLDLFSTRDSVKYEYLLDMVQYDLDALIKLTKPEST